MDARAAYPSHQSQEECLRDISMPVILLLGWSGCEYRYLKKYSDIYADRCITVSYIAPVQKLFFQPSHLLHLTEDLLKHLKDIHLDTHPVIVHSFSNGGTCLFAYMTKLLQAKYSLTIKGVIIDSAPAPHSRIVAMKALSAAVQNLNFIIRYIMLSSFGCFLVAGSIFSYIFGLLGLRVDPFNTVDAAVCNDENTYPQLFIYSKADKIVDYEFVEGVIEERKKKSKVESICFDDSPHVMHLRSHPEVYKNSCLQFIEQCMSKL